MQPIASQVLASREQIPPPDRAPLVLLPPARRARRIALVLSIVAVAFSFASGFGARRSYALYSQTIAPERLMPWVIAFLVLLLLALLFRMGAAICELLWLERTWSNLPAGLRKVGPIDDVSSGLALAVSFVPGIAWVWKLGLIVGIANGFEAIRAAQSSRRFALLKCGRVPRRSWRLVPPSRCSSRCSRCFFRTKSS